MSLTWTQQSSPIAPFGVGVYGLAASAAGTICQASDVAGNIVIYRSTDGGVSWTLVLTHSGLTNSNGGSMACDGSVFVISDFQNNLILRSTDDGLTWSSVSSSSTNAIPSFAFDGAGTWLGFEPNTGFLIRSTDGAATWSRIPCLAVTTQCVIWDGTQFVGTIGSANIITSPDGITWTLNTGFSTNLGRTWANQITHQAGHYLVVTRNQGYLNTVSSSVPTWAPGDLDRITPVDTSVGLYMMAGAGVWAAANASAAGQYASSTDAVTWEPDFIIPNGAFSVGTYVPIKNIFVFGTDNGHIFTSNVIPPRLNQRGYTWTKKTPPTPGGADLTRGIAVSSAGTWVTVSDVNSVGLRLMRSTDAGVTWTQVLQSGSVPAVAGEAVWSNGVFIVVAGAAILWRSTDDGLTWTSTALGTPQSPVALASNGTGTWVGLDANNGGTVVSTDNGATWVHHTTYANYQWFNILWDGAQWVALGINVGGSINIVATSPDGFTWTEFPVVNGASGVQFTYRGFIFNGTNYVANLLSTPTALLIGSTPANLAAATPVSFVLPTSSQVSRLDQYNGLSFISGSTGDIGVSSDPSAQVWIGESTLRAATGGPVNQFAYDPVHALYIAITGSTNGQLWTAPSPPPPVVWTYRTTLAFNGNVTLGAACAPNGTCLVQRFDQFGGSEMYRSVDGGLTWTHITTYPGFNGGYGFVFYNNGVWFSGNYPSVNWISLDDGLTWIQKSNGAGSGSHGGVGDGGTHIVITENSGAQVTVSDNNGTTTVLSSMPGSTTQAVAAYNIVWDGTSFVSLDVDNASSPLQYTVYTAPSGWTASPGPVWTPAGTVSATVANPGTTGGGGSGPVIAFSPTIGYLIAATLPSNVGGAVFLGSTPANVFANPPIPVFPGVGGTAAAVNIANGRAFFSDNQYNFAESADGATWTREAPSFNVANSPSDLCTFVLFDPIHNVLIAIGGRGSVSTTPTVVPGSPIIVPDVVGLTVTAANALLNSNGCSLGAVTSAPSQTVPAGRVISQNPVAGTHSFAVAVVSVVVSTGPRTISISPTSVTVPWGGTVRFTATTGNPSGASVFWSATYGSISNGVYVAPIHPSVATDIVTARLSDDFTVSDTATVTFQHLVNPQPPFGPFGPLGLRGAFRSPRVFPPVMLAKAGTINPKIYMPEDSSVIKT